MSISRFSVSGIIGLTLLSQLPRVASAVEVAFEQDSSLPMVFLNVAVKAGSTTDPENQSGLTNFMGEMLLRGTKTRTKEQIDLAIDQMGARLEVETRAEALILRGAVLTSQLDNFLSLITELVTQSTFPENEISKLKSEVVSGILEELGRDSSLGSRRFTKFLFHGHPYGKPILGTVRDIQKLARPTVLSQYDRLVLDKYLLVVGTGDAPTEKIRKWASALGGLRAKSGETISKLSAPKDEAHRRVQIIDKPQRTQTQINVGQIGVLMTDPAYFPLYLGNYAFGGPTFSSRLMVEIRVKRGWSYGANSAFRFGTEPRSWHAHLFPAAKDTPAALSETLKLIDELKTKGITQAEFDFSKRSIVNSAGFMFNTSRKRVENKLLERTLNLPDGFMKSHGPEIEKVTYASVNNALKEFLKPDRLAISVLGTAPELKEKIAKAAGVPVDQIEVVPYTQE